MIPWSFRPDLPLAGIWSLEESERYCLSMASRHYENFPVVSRILGRDVRRSLAAVYAFARIADDFADEPGYDGMRLELLDAWEAQIDEGLAGRARHPVFIALGAAAARHGIAADPLHDLVSAFRQDCTVKRYGTLDELLDYCSRSADPVGRLVLRILDSDDERSVQLSDRTCTALQLANFWQDLSVDVLRDRLYVPLDLACQRDVSEQQLLARRRSCRMDALVQDLVEHARSLMRSARALPGRLDMPGRLYLEAVQRGGLAILDAVARLGDRALVQRPTLRRRDSASILVKSSASSIRAGAV